MGCKQLLALVLLAAVVSGPCLLQDLDPEIQASERQDRNHHHNKPINKPLTVANLQVLVTLHLIGKNVKHDSTFKDSASLCCPPPGYG
jgi:exosome complex RNA-binding protein Rrp42 (RNase PH superfamily)